MAVQTTTQLQIYTFINVIYIIYSNIYACQSLIYRYSFVTSFELNTFQFVYSLAISSYDCAHMRGLVFVTDKEVLFYFP